MTEDPFVAILSSPALRVRGTSVETLREMVAREAPLEIRINGRAHTMLMVSPINLEALALGFCLSEGLASPDEVLGVRMGRSDLPGLGPVWWADVTLPAELARAAKVRRVAAAASSCGVCGLQSASQLRLEIPPVSGDNVRVEATRILQLISAMEAGQGIFSRTGGTHAAALGLPGGELISMAEDIGRHNALDKAIGLAVKAGRDPRACLAVLSGRISYEMAAKAARVGIPLLGSVSAPTGMSVGMLQRLGITLAGFGRGDRVTIYTHPHRILLDGRPLDAAWA